MSPLFRITTALSLLWALVAPASAQPATFNYRLVNTVAQGQPAALVLAPTADVTGVKIVVRQGRRQQVFDVGPLAAGEEKRVEWKAPGGTSQWRAELSGRAGGVPVNAGFDFEVTTLGPLEVRLDKGETDLPAGLAVVRANRPLKSADVTVRDDTGAIIVETSVDVPEAAAGEAQRVSWAMPSDAQVRAVDLKLHDHHTFWAALRAASWFADIGHEEVVFETGKWDIRPTEAPKLDAAIAEIQKEIEKFRASLGADALVEGALFVAGYTDTVGHPGDNQTLSQHRAEAIAGYFRDHGLKLPIFAQGFGESALAVATADEVDQPQNRRARYVLGNAPPGGPDFPRRSWKKAR